MQSCISCKSWQVVRAPENEPDTLKHVRQIYFNFEFAVLQRWMKGMLNDYVKVWLLIWNVRHYLVCTNHQVWTDCLGIPRHTVHISCLHSLEDSHMLLVRQCPGNMCGQTCKSSHKNAQRCGKVAMQYMTLKLESITSVFLLFFLLLSRKWKWEKKHINIKKNMWSLWQHRWVSSSNWG
jgi:hypothetical protein